MQVRLKYLVLGLAAASLSASGLARKADDQIAPQSLTFLQQGESLLAAGKLVEADEALETSLAVDPRNRAAFVAMARVAMKEKLYGQAIRHTRKALALEPNDVAALSVQGEAMVELGALAKAKENLAKIGKICAKKGCAEYAALSGAISRGPAMAAAKPVETPKTN